MFARPLTGISWSCDAEQQDMETKFPASRSAPLITTVHDISISVNGFCEHFKAELICRAYGTDLAPMLQLSVNSLCEHIFLTYLLTYLLYHVIGGVNVVTGVSQWCIC